MSTYVPHLSEGRSHEQRRRLPTSNRGVPMKDSDGRVLPNNSSRMSWSWRIGRIAGIDVYMHATFLILLGWLLLEAFLTVYVAHKSTVAEAAAGVATVLALFGCVILHELGHALTARHFGVRTLDITLLPIGGVARLENIPKVPRQELLIALAGPAVSLAIAGFLFGILWIVGAHAVNFQHTMIGKGATPLADLMQLNAMLAIFNLLPAFPMDGGRVLRAILSMRMPRLKATRIASILGQGMAALFALLGLMGQPFLLFIALFVYLGASQEYQAIHWETVMEGLLVHDAMITEFHTLPATDPVSCAVALSLQGSQHDFPVVDDSCRIVGLLLRQDLLAAVCKDRGASMPVSAAMRKIEMSAAPDEPLDKALRRMQEVQTPLLPVLGENGILRGLLTLENVAERMMFRTACHKWDFQSQPRKDL